MSGHKRHDHNGLKPRHVDVLKQLLQGHSNKEIARTLGITERVVKGSRSEMFKVSETRNSCALCVWATWRGYADEFRPPSEPEMLVSHSGAAVVEAAGGAV